MPYKENFINQLRLNLLWHYNWEEIIDILEEYEMYFESETSNGKTEEEICIEFGNPKKIAEQLCSEIGKNKSNILNSNKAWKGIAVIGLIISLAYIYLKNLRLYGNETWFQCIFTLALPILLWYILGGMSTKVQAMKSVLYNKTGVIIQVVVILIPFLLYLIEEYGLQYYINNLPIDYNPEKAGTIIKYLFYTIAFLSILIEIYILYKFWNGWIAGYFFIPQVSGVISSIVLTYYKHSEFKMDIGFEFTMFVPYLAGLGLAIVYYYFLIYRQKLRTSIAS